MGDFRKKREDGGCPLKSLPLKTKSWKHMLQKGDQSSCAKHFHIYHNTVHFKKGKQNILHVLLHLSTRWSNNFNVFANYNIPLFYLHSFGNQYPEVFCIHHPSVCHLPVMGSDFLPINMQKITLITSGVASFLTHSFPMHPFFTPWNIRKP